MSPTSLKHNSFARTLARPFRAALKKVNKEKYVMSEYKYVTGHKANLKQPTRYTEKLQILRLYQYPKNDLVSKAASRSGMRDYAKNKGFEDNLIKIYGVFDTFKEDYHYYKDGLNSKVQLQQV